VRRSNSDDTNSTGTAEVVARLHNRRKTNNLPSSKEREARRIELRRRRRM
jgi:hypothetical protein